VAHSATAAGGTGVRRRTQSRRATPAAARVTLSAITAADAPVLFRWINERDLVLFNAPFRPVHEASHREWVAGLAKRRDLVAFGIRLKKGGRLIGTCQLTGINPVGRSADLQIRIGVAGARGKGLGLEAVRLLLAFGFRDLNLHRIALQVFATNARAIKTYEAAGFRHEGTIRDGAFIDGRFVDVAVMGMLESEFAG
jgi:diamine N-acetyltransferase